MSDSLAPYRVFYESLAHNFTFTVDYIKAASEREATVSIMKQYKPVTGCTVRVKKSNRFFYWWWHSVLPGRTKK